VSHSGETAVLLLPNFPSKTAPHNFPPPYFSSCSQTLLWSASFSVFFPFHLGRSPSPLNVGNPVPPPTCPASLLMCHESKPLFRANLMTVTLLSPFLFPSLAAIFLPLDVYASPVPFPKSTEPSPRDGRTNSPELFPPPVRPPPCAQACQQFQSPFPPVVTATTSKW